MHFKVSILVNLVNFYTTCTTVVTAAGSTVSIVCSSKQQCIQRACQHLNVAAGRLMTVVNFVYIVSVVCITGVNVKKSANSFLTTHLH